MKYPRLSRSQSLNCKLSDSDIKQIQRLFSSGSKRVELAKKFKVDVNTITYWCMSPEDRKKRNRKWYLASGQYESKEKRRAKQLRSTRRKARLMPELKIYSKFMRLKTKELKKQKAII